MSVRAIGPVVATLSEMALNGTEFSIAIAEKQGEDWAFKSMSLGRCIITSANPSNVVIDGAPGASFNCSALDVGLEV